jgi:uncharacterized protein with beta-barrel porin domain
VRRDLAGFITGLDTRVGASGRAGIAAGYTGSKNALDGRGSRQCRDRPRRGLWRLELWRAQPARRRRLCVPQHRHRSAPSRSRASSIAPSRTIDGGTGQVFGEAGYGFAFGNVAVEPFAGGAWVRLEDRPRDRARRPAALNVPSNVRGRLFDARRPRRRHVPLGDGMVLVPRATSALAARLGRRHAGGAARIPGAGAPFAIRRADRARLAARRGRLDLAIGRKRTLGVSYTGQLARNVHDHAAKGKFSWKFN